MPHVSVSAEASTAGTAAAPPYLLKYETVSGSGDDLQLRSLLDRQQFKYAWIDTHWRPS